MNKIPSMHWYVVSCKPTLQKFILGDAVPHKELEIFLKKESFRVYCEGWLDC